MGPINRSSPVTLEAFPMPPFIHRPTNSGFDSRRYATRRWYLNFRYYDMPAVNDAMTFMLPPFQNLHSRLVKVGPKLWQLWSPNSPLNAFYPRIRAPGFKVKMENDEEKRRFDGHLGRFDPTRSLQHFDARRPWQGFVRRDRTTSSRVEHIPSFLAWESLPPHNGSHDLGRLDTAFIIQLTSRNIELEAIMTSCEESPTSYQLIGQTDRYTPSRTNYIPYMVLYIFRQP